VLHNNLTAKQLRVAIEAVVRPISSRHHRYR
jgi:hypothetical protein